MASRGLAHWGRHPLSDIHIDNDYHETSSVHARCLSLFRFRDTVPDWGNILGALDWKMINLLFRNVFLFFMNSLLCSSLSPHQLPVISSFCLAHIHRLNSPFTPYAVYALQLASISLIQEAGVGPYLLSGFWILRSIYVVSFFLVQFWVGVFFGGGGLACFAPNL